VDQHEPVTILRNKHPATHWVRVSLQGRAGKDPAGAVVQHQHEGRVITQTVCGGGSYLSSSDRRILCVTGHDDPIDVTVIWPGGSREQFTGLSSRSTHELIEGTGRRP
jgi:hypothetical protein